MSGTSQLILGELPSKLDERYRLSIPGKLADSLPSQCILAKERSRLSEPLEPPRRGKPNSTLASS